MTSEGGGHDVGVPWIPLRAMTRPPEVPLTRLQIQEQQERISGSSFPSLPSSGFRFFVRCCCSLFCCFALQEASGKGLNVYAIVFIAVSHCRAQRKGDRAT